MNHRFGVAFIPLANNNNRAVKERQKIDDTKIDDTMRDIDII